MDAEVGATGRGWPFWAPSPDAARAAALDLAAIEAGDVVADLGCGDGTVLLEAAARGAGSVIGVESDPDLAADARRLLADLPVGAQVLEADLLVDPLPCADVLLAYLAPATLQRLVPSLGASGARCLVTIDFEVPGLTPSVRSGRATRYELPPVRARRPGRSGFASAGTLLAAVPDHQSLHCLTVVHPGGRTSTWLTGPVREAASVFAGADHLAGPAVLAIDLRAEEAPAGTIAAGSIRVSGIGTGHPVFVVHDAEEDGMWDLDAGAVGAIRRALRRRRPPRSIAEFLAAAEA